MSRAIARLCISVVFLCFPAAARAQNEAPGVPLSVFIDCDTYLCDFDYFRTEMPYVNYVRDRLDADVHVLVTTQTTGGGGREFSASFIGLGEYDGVEETLTHTSDPTATDDEVRGGLTQVLRMGLLRYISRTPFLDRFDLTYTGPEGAVPQTRAEDDPWNYWVVNLRLNGRVNGEDRYNYTYFNGSASASRTTEELKLNLSVNGSRRRQVFELSDGTRTVDVQETLGVFGRAGKSVGPRWTIGGILSANRSTRLNYDVDLLVAPVIEYNVFPYSESTRKMLTFQYAIGVNHFDYADSTIFGKVDQTLLRHRVASYISFKQPWGNVRLTMDAAQFLFDRSKFNLGLGGNAEWRIFRGFSLNLGGDVSFVRDQLYLPKGDATDEDVLLRRRELETNWRYYFNVGISYRFGSKFNNVVNPRFNQVYF